MPRTILVTGGTGFIGHHFVGLVLERTDWGVVVLDGLTYAGDVSRLTCLPGFSGGRVRLYWHDLRAPIGDRLADEIGPVSAIVNIASDSHVDRSISDPVAVVHNNVMLAAHVLQYARRAQPEAVLMVSTDEVYGPAPYGTFHREWDSHIPSNPYSASKAAQDDLAVAWWRTYGVPVISTRTQNNFGERQHPEKFVPRAIRLLLEGTPVPIHAELRQTPAGPRWIPGSRVWLHARTHASALLFLLRHLAAHVARFPWADRPDRFNIAGDVELSNLEVVHKIARVLGVEPRYQFVDFHSSRPGHDLRYALDGGKLRSFGWQGSDIDLDFDRTVRWYMDNQDWLRL